MSRDLRSIGPVAGTLMGLLSLDGGLATLGVAIGWISVGGSSSETSGRVVFGIVAVMAGIFTLWGLIYGLRRLAGRGRATRSGRREKEES